MTNATITTADSPAARSVTVAALGPVVVAALLFAVVFAKPAILLVQDWWTDPESGHGLLLAPAAIWLAWKRGLLPDRRPQPWLGLLLLGTAALVRVASELAAELFTMRASMMLALAGLVIFWMGLRQVLAWWLPFLLLFLAIPLPELVRSGLALPLQFRASELGAELLRWRHIPVRLSGNIIEIPGHRLFVTEACSGLRSLTALLSLAVLMGGLWLRAPLLRVLLLVIAVPVAVLINGVRVFLTGFLVYFVDPALGEGFMHVTEGWLLFLVSFVLVGLTAWLLHFADAWWQHRRAHHA